MSTITVSDLAELLPVTAQPPAPANHGRRPDTPDRNETPAIVRYTLHDFVGIDVVNGSKKDIDLVEKHIGPIRSQSRRPTDLTLHFTDKLRHDGTLRLIGVDEAAFDDERFYILRNKHKSVAKVALDMQTIGSSTDVVCERGLASIPLLLPLINHSALAKGVLPLHASAVRYRGKGILILGWAQGGKTETLLSFLNAGAEYVGDEWVYVSPDGSRLMGIPEPVFVWKWHLEELPKYWSRISKKKRRKFAALDLAIRGLQPFTNSKSRNVSFGTRFRSLLERQQNLYVPPATLFEGQMGDLATDFDMVLFVASHEARAMATTPVDPSIVAGKVRHSLSDERDVLMTWYKKYRFAFPERSNTFLEQADETEWSLLQAAFAEKPAFAFHHPYPLPIAEIAPSISKVIGL